MVSKVGWQIYRSVDWYVDKLEQKYHKIEDPDNTMYQAMQLANVPDDVIRAVTDKMTRARAQAGESIQKWKEVSDALNEICLSQKYWINFGCECSKIFDFRFSILFLSFYIFSFFVNLYFCIEIIASDSLDDTVYP